MGDIVLFVRLCCKTYSVSGMRWPGGICNICNVCVYVGLKVNDGVLGEIY